MTRLVIELGEQRGVRAKDLVGAITTEANIGGEAIGAIEIGEKQSLVEVLDAEVDNVIRALSRATIRGQRVTVRRERGG
jgi:ATP-dependent RNA helicase DeaD